jgi:23S rRNA pseudouridine2605 synthase
VGTVRLDLEHPLPPPASICHVELKERKKTMEKTTPDSLNLIRLNRFLAQCGLGARRKCDELIKSGHVLVNGVKVAELGTKVSIDDKVEYRGKTAVRVRRLEYWAYHKPPGVMVTKDDPQGRTTVFKALQQAGFDAGHLNYIGRLDYVSEGLLLFTNDGSLIHGVTHPRYHIKKVYKVQINRPLAGFDEEKLLRGIESEGQVLHAGAVKKIKGPAAGNWYEVDLYEGKNRQLRRMFEALHYQVVRLLRIRFASVRLDDLAVGAIRPLTPREIAGLKSTGYTGGSAGGFTRKKHA